MTKWSKLNTADSLKYVDKLARTKLEFMKYIKCTQRQSTLNDKYEKVFRGSQDILYYINIRPNNT